MGIPLSAELEITARVTGGRDRRVDKSYRLEVFEIASELKSLDTYFPTCLARRSVADGDVTARGDETAGESALFQNREGCVRSVALGDPAQIEEHAVDLFQYGAFFRIEDEMVEASAGFRRVDLIRSGKHPILPPHAPQPDDGSGSDVKSTAGLLRELTGLFEKSEEILAHRKSLTCGGFRQLIDLRLGQVIREGAV